MEVIPKKSMMTKEFAEWSDEIHRKDFRARLEIDRAVRKIEKGLVKAEPVGEGVHELKIHYQQGFRLYFTNKNNELILLLCGGTKKRQQQDIVYAKELKKIYL